jgi:hypothetical protein
MPVGVPALRYRFDGEYIHRPIAMPSSAAPVPIPEVQMTKVLHSGACRRMGVK